LKNRDIKRRQLNFSQVVLLDPQGSHSGQNSRFIETQKNKKGNFPNIYNLVALVIFKVIEFLNETLWCEVLED